MCGNTFYIGTKKLNFTNEKNQKLYCFYNNDGEKGDLCEILMAVHSCMISYCYIGRKIVADPVAQRLNYWDFIRDYANDHYEAICHKWGKYADMNGVDLLIAKWKKLRLIFE